MKKTLGILSLCAVLIPAIINAAPVSSKIISIDLNGFWTSNDYICLGGKTYEELFRIADDGNNYQAVKLAGDECVTTGSVSFFGSRNNNNINTGTCHIIVGNQTNPTSVLTDCDVTIIDNDTINVYGSTLKRFKQNG